MRERRAGVWVTAAVWLVGVAVAFFALEAYKATPGAAGGAPAHCAHDLPRGAVLLFLHPHCPCSRSSVAELAAVLTARPAAPAHVYFVRPGGAPEGWDRPALWEVVARMPNVTVHCDERGGLARRLGAKTSGHALLYDARGELRFSGGITAVRGHEGDNVGRRSLLAALDGGAPMALHYPVFGCPLLGPEDQGETDSSSRAGNP